MKLPLFPSALLILGIQFFHSANLDATTYYWDTNDSTAGFGTAGGTWAAPTTNNSTQGWSTSSAGTNAMSGTSTSTTSNTLIFGTATDGLAAGTITISGSVNANSINFGSASGAITLTTGTITLGGTTPGIAVDNSTNTISAKISGSAGLTKNGTGTLTLSGTNNFSGALTINAGSLVYQAPSNYFTFSPTGINVNNGSTVTIQGSYGFWSSKTFTFDSNGGGEMIIGYGNNVFRGDQTFTTNGGNQNTISGGTLNCDNAGTRTFNVADGTDAIDLLISAKLSNTMNLAKTGAGTMTITSSATDYSGNTTISAGTFEIGGSGKLGGGSYAGNISNSATFTYNSTSAQTLSGVISGTGDLIKSNSGTLTLSGANTYTGSTTVNAGTLSIGNSMTIGSIAGSGALVIGTGSTLTTNSSSSTTYSGTMSGAGSLTKNGSGTLTITGATSSGAITINGGSLVLQAPSTYAGLNASGININNGSTVTIQGFYGMWASKTFTFDSNGGGAMIIGTGNNVFRAAQTFTTNGGNQNTISGGALNCDGAGPHTFNIADGTDDTDLLVSAAIQGIVSIQKTGAGKMSLSSATNTYSGSTTITGGTLEISGAGKLGSGSYAGAISNSGTFSYNSTADQTLSGVISGSGSLTKSSSGSLTLSGSNTYTGGTTLTNSNLEMGADGALGNGTFTFNPTATSRLRLNGTNQTITGLTILGASFTVIENQGGGSGVLTIQIAGGETSSSTGTFYFRDHNVGSGTLALIKTGDGTLDFSTYNTMNYTGGLTVNAGTMSYNNVAALGGGTITLGGGTLNYTGSGSATIARNTTLSVGTTSSLDNAAGSVTLSGVVSGSGALTKNGAGTLTLSGSNTYSGGTTLNAGTLVIGNSAAAGTGTITQADGTSLLKFDTTGTVANDLSIYNVSSNKTLTLSGNITAQNTTYDVASGTTTSLNGTISGSGGITKNGTGTLEVNGANNTYTGDTVINAGTLEANASGALGATGNITVHNGGSILVQASNAIGNSTNVNLNGGTWAFNGDISDTVGALTLSANSTIDMSGGNISLTFASLASALTSSTRLNVYNYTLYSDHIYFTSDTNLSNSLQYISFYSGFGTGFIGSSFIESLSSPYQVRPVPEPETWATAALLLIGGGIWIWRKRRAEV